MASLLGRSLSTVTPVTLLLACSQPRASAVPEAAPVPTREASPSGLGKSRAARRPPAPGPSTKAESLGPGDHEVVLHAVSCPDGEVRAAVVVGGQSGEAKRFPLGKYAKCPRTGRSELLIELGCTSAEFHHGAGEPGQPMPLVEYTTLTMFRVTVVGGDLVLRTRTRRPWMRPGYDVEESRRVLITLTEPSLVRLLKPNQETSAAACDD